MAVDRLATRVVVHVLVAAGLTSLLAGCSGSGGSSSSSSYGSSNSTSISCDDVFATALQRVRVGDTAGQINAEIDWLSQNCPNESDVLIGYASARATIDASRLESCDVWLDRIGLDAAELLWDDRLCTAESSETDAGGGAATQPGGGIAWNEAINYVGSTQRVCGPLATLRTSDDDVFLNIGRVYPDSGRFVIVVWDIGGLEPIPPGKTLCTTGMITYWEGIAEIELRDPSLIEIWD